MNKKKKQERKKQRKLQKFLNRHKEDNQETPMDNLSPPAKELKTVKRSRPAVVIFNAYAWAKLNYLRDKGSTEVGVFGIALHDSPLTVVDIIMVKQKASIASIKFDDIAVANFFEDQVEAGKQPYQFARIWLHTHPGNCASPSGVDVSTFEDVFGRCDWAVMAILARGGDISARLRYNIGIKNGVTIKAESEIKVKVDYTIPFLGSDIPGWDKEYEQTLEKEITSFVSGSKGRNQFNEWPDCFGTRYTGHGRLDAFEDPHEDWRHTYDPDYKKNVISGEKGIVVIDHTKDQCSEVTQLSSDDMPIVHWPLKYELEDSTVEEKAVILEQLDLTLEEADNYVCWYDKDGGLIAQLDPSFIDAYQEEDFVMSEDTAITELKEQFYV